VPTISSQLCTRLKQLRLASGLTQEEYAELCGIPYKVYQHIERGRRANPRLSTLEKLAKGVGLSVFDLFSQNVPKVAKISRKPSSPHYKRKKEHGAVQKA
jgi:transcriptional regulator with XRE-family HTH domain